MKMYGKLTLIAAGHTNGNPSDRSTWSGNDVEFFFNESDHNSPGKPDRILIKWNGGELREIGYIDILPDGGMTVFKALTMWGHNRGQTELVGKILHSIASFYAADAAHFLSANFLKNINHPQH